MQPRWTALRCGARRAATALALTLVALLAGGAASAQAGPGITIKQGATGPTKLISGGQIAGAADASGTYTLRERPSDPGDAGVRERPVDPGPA